MKIPFYRPSIDSVETEQVLQTLNSGWLTTGPRTKQFEAGFAEYMKHLYAVAVNSCTAALHLALEAAGVKAGDTVVVPTMTFAATAEVVRYFNANPLLVDCRSEDFNLDVADAERRIKAALKEGARISAIMPVHYGGQIGDVAGVQMLAKRYHLKIIEDAAHCCPAYFRQTETAPWETVGSTADISCYSFYANKCITTGEGGMACTDREEYAARMRIMSLHGISKDAWKRFTAEGSWYYEIIAPGFKYNMTDIAAAIGIGQLAKADRMHQKRQERAALYTSLLGDVDEVLLPVQQPNRIHSWHLYVVRLRLDNLKMDRAACIELLKNEGIGTSVHWMPLHLHPYYRQKYQYEAGDLPTAADLYPEILSLPLYPDMKLEEVEFVCETLKTLLAQHRRVCRRPSQPVQPLQQPGL